MEKILFTWERVKGRTEPSNESKIRPEDMSTEDYDLFIDPLYSKTHPLTWAIHGPSRFIVNR